VDVISHPIISYPIISFAHTPTYIPHTHPHIYIILLHIYTCTCIYIYIYIFGYICIYIYIHIYIYIYIFMNYIYIYTHMRKFHACTCIHDAPVSRFIPARKCSYISARIHVHIYMKLLSVIIPARRAADVKYIHNILHIYKHIKM